MNIGKYSSVLLLVIAISLWMVKAAYAFSDESDKPFSGIYFFSETHYNEESEDIDSPVLIMLFSKITMGKTFHGHIIAIGSEIDLRTPIDGEIFGLLSTIIEDGIDKTNEIAINLKYILFILHMILGLLLLSVFKDWHEQSALAMIDKPLLGIQYGAAIYGMFAALIAIFSFTLIGALVSVLLLLAIFTLTVVGEVSLSICIGYYMSRKTGTKSEPFILFLSGCFLIETVKLIPFVGILINITIVPILSLGCLSKWFVDTFVLKIYHDVHFDASNDYDKQEIRAIITKNIDK